MVEFMVIAAPRCGTTWASNWLTTDDTLCLHDPLFTRHYTELDSIKSKRRIGISCTGIYFWPEWINDHPARKVILHRPLAEINRSLDGIGLPSISMHDLRRLERINGMHVFWRDLFDSPSGIYEYLLQKPFDEERHSELKHIEMQPDFAGLKVGMEVTRRLINELKGV